MTPLTLPECVDDARQLGTSADVVSEYARETAVALQVLTLDRLQAATEAGDEDAVRTWAALAVKANENALCAAAFGGPDMDPEPEPEPTQ